MLVKSQIKHDVEKMKLKNVNKSLLNCCTHHTNSEDEGFVHLSKSTSVNNTTFFHNYNDVVTGIVLIFKFEIFVYFKYFSALKLIKCTVHNKGCVIINCLKFSFYISLNTELFITLLFDL